ncbi:MAG: FAD-dependent oxidoreductase [Planctomycetaceae bacterium]|nr:FAD-dependent oxidoreductase [Planctomycetaceae bacterium]
MRTLSFTFDAASQLTATSDPAASYAYTLDNLVLRMEPLWMATGQIAGKAAAVAKEQSPDVAQIDPVPLPAALEIRVDRLAK